MMMNVRYGVALAAALAIMGGAAVPTHASANLLSNGSFEDPPITGGFNTIGAGGSIGAWSVGDNGVDLIHDYWTAADGLQSVDMSALSTGTLSQTVNTTAGRNYNLTFWIAGNVEGFNTIKSMNTLIDGNVVGTEFFNITGHTKANMGWTEYSYNFTSAGGPTTVSFQSLDANPCGMALDNVSLKAVPEASTVVLFSLMLVGGGLLLRKRTARSL